jgi:uncharacterized membrane protein (DUF485 family)
MVVPFSMQYVWAGFSIPVKMIYLAHIQIDAYNLHALKKRVRLGMTRHWNIVILVLVLMSVLQGWLYDIRAETSGRISTR